MDFLSVFILVCLLNLLGRTVGNEAKCHRLCGRRDGRLENGKVSIGIVRLFTW